MHIKCKYRRAVCTHTWCFSCIHCCYWSERSPNIDLLKDKLIKYELIERLNAIKTDKIPLHNGKWEKFINIFGKINVV